MNIYFFLGYLIFINLFFKNLKNKRMEALIVLIPMFISLATQVDIGRDYYSYIKIFLDPTHHKKVEWGYYIYTQLLKLLSNNYRILFVGISALQIFLFYKILLKLYKKNIIENFYLFTLSFILFSGEYRLMFNGLRSSVATLFFTLFILEFQENKKKSLIYAILSLSFHKSAFIGIVIFILFNKFFKKYYSKKIIFLFFLLSFFVNQMDIIHKIALFVYNLGIEIPYRHYLISEHMFPYHENLATRFLIYFYLVVYSFVLFLQMNYHNKCNTK